MEIVYKNVDELKEYQRNPRDNEAAVPKVAESIQNFGFINPIAITADNVIIAGHTRLKAAKSLGIESVPCVVHNISDEEARLARIADNKSNEYATWDVFKLQTEIDRLPLNNLTFFKSDYRDVKTRLDDLTLSFGNIKIPVRNDEYSRLKEVFDDYINRESSYLGFISYLLEGKNVSD